MLICPQCQFKNPDVSNICQQGGTAMKYRVCPSCSAEVEVSLEQYPQCGDAVGDRLLDRNRPDEAIAYYKLVLGLDPNSAEGAKGLSKARQQLATQSAQIP